MIAGLAALLLTLAPAASATTPAPPRPLPVTTTQPAAVTRALDLVTARSQQAVAIWIEIAGTPSLSGQEATRARLFARLLTEAGVPARVMPSGNVEGRVPGREAGPPAVIAAHLDTIHAPDEGQAVRRDGPVLRGPGVLDDASGLAAIVSAARALRDAGWTPRREVRFVATVGEEVGLVGAHSYIAENPELAAFVAVDGILGRVEHGATGIRWTRWTMTGRGGHTLVAAHVPSPSIAAARAITAIADAAENSDALLNVSGVRSGDAPNSVPVKATFTVDIRCDVESERQRLTREMESLVQDAAAREGVSARSEILQDLPAARLPGHERSELVRGAVDVLRHLGLAPSAWPRGSSDANVALLRGIPAIAVGATTGRMAHAPSEEADIAPLLDGTRQIVLLAVLVGEGLGAEPVAQ